MPHLPFCSSSAASPSISIRLTSPVSSFRSAARNDSFRAGEASFNSAASFEIQYSANSPSAASQHTLLASLQSQSAVSAAALIARSSGEGATGSPDPSLIVYFASGPDVSVIDLDSFQMISTFSTPSPIRSLAFSTDTSRIFTAHRDHRVRIWSSSPDHLRHRLVSSLPTPSDVLRRSPIPSNYVQIRRHRHLLWIRHADVVSSLAFAGDLLFSASWDKTLKIWNAAKGFRCVASVPAHDDAINAVAADPGSATVYTASADRRILAWAASPTPGAKLSPLATLDAHRSAVNALALSADGAVLYSGSGDRTVVAWERGEGHRKAAKVLRGHTRAVMCLAVVDDLVLSGSTDRTVRIWRRSAGYRCIAVLEGHRNGVRSVAACRVGTTASEMEYRVCSGSVDGEMRVWGIWVSSDWGSDSPTRDKNGC